MIEVYLSFNTNPKIVQVVATKFVGCMAMNDVNYQLQGEKVNKAP